MIIANLIRYMLFFLRIYPITKIESPSIIINNISSRNEKVFSSDESKIGEIIDVFRDSLSTKGYHFSNFCRMYNGLSGQKFRILLSELAELSFINSYMEIGTFNGSTLLSVLSNKSKKTIKAVTLDNWFKSGASAKNVYRMLSSLPQSVVNDVSVLSEDMYKFDFTPYFGSFDIFFYDGPHSFGDQKYGVKIADKCLKDFGVLIVDDWNLERIRQATFESLQELERTIVSSIEVVSSESDIRDSDSRFGHWGRGIGLFVLKKI